MTINPDVDGPDINGLRAMPSARAGRASHRANLRCLGLSVGIAIAALSLAGCRFGSGYDPGAWKRDEIPPSSYSDVAYGAAHDPVERDMVRSFMADGRIDYGELEQINDYGARKANDAVPLARLKGELASGTEAGTGETEGLDPKGDGPAPKGDARP